MPESKQIVRFCQQSVNSENVEKGRKTRRIGSLNVEHRPTLHVELSDTPRCVGKLGCRNSPSKKAENGE